MNSGIVIKSDQLITAKQADAKKPLLSKYSDSVYSISDHFHSFIQGTAFTNHTKHRPQDKHVLTYNKNRIKPKMVHDPVIFCTSFAAKHIRSATAA